MNEENLREDSHGSEMERMQQVTPQEALTMGEALLGFLQTLTKWRRFIVWFVLISTVSVVIIAFLLPKWYRSTASVFPAEQANIFPGLEGVSSLVKTLSAGGTRRLGGLTGPTEADRYTAILKSDRVLNAMIQKFNLIEVYDFVGAWYAQEKTAKVLLENTEIQVQDEGNLTISVLDKDPHRAADMANYYVDLLNIVNAELMAQNARGNRTFIEQRYTQNLTDLKASEEAMKTFQIKHGVIAVPEQTEATVKAGAELYGRLVSKEIELNVMKQSLGESHPSYAAAKAEIEATRRTLDEMNSGSDKAAGEIKLLIPFKQAPQLATEYVRLYRNLQIQNKILEFITPLFEQAKIEEQRNTPSVVVLDRGSVPERKAKPKVTLYALLALVLSSLLSLLVVFVAEGIARLKALYPSRYQAIVGPLRSDWFGLRSFPFFRRGRK